SAPFARIRAAPRAGGATYLVNERGDYLVAPDPSREFGFELGRPSRVQDDISELVGALEADDPSPRIVRDRAGNAVGAALASVRLAGGPRVTVIDTVPYAYLTAAAGAVRSSTLIAGLLAALGAAALAVLLARSLTRPLAQMTAAVQAFGRGEPLALP